MESDLFQESSSRETTEDEVFKDAENPYGHRVIVFPSDSGDSRFVVVEGHHLPTRRILATFNWVLRNYGILFLIDRPASSFIEYGYARYYEFDDVFRVMFGRSGSTCTYAEV